MNDRHRAEVSFLGRLVYLIIVHGLKNQDKEHERMLGDVALLAAMEPLEGMLDKRKSQIQRRVIRMEENTVKKCFGNCHTKQVVLTTYYFIKHLIDCDYISFPEESAMSQIFTYLLSLIDLKEPDIQQYLPSSYARSKEWLTTLQKEGYY